MEHVEVTLSIDFLPGAAASAPMNIFAGPIAPAESMVRAVHNLKSPVLPVDTYKRDLQNYSSQPNEFNQIC